MLVGIIVLMLFSSSQGRGSEFAVLMSGRALLRDCVGGFLATATATATAIVTAIVMGSFRLMTFPAHSLIYMAARRSHPPLRLPSAVSLAASSTGSSPSEVSAQSFPST